MSDSQPSPVFTPAQAAEYLNLAALGVEHPEQSVRSYAERGELEYIKISGRVAFLKDQLDIFLMQRRQRRGVHGDGAGAVRRRGRRAKAAGLRVAAPGGSV